MLLRLLIVVCLLGAPLPIIAEPCQIAAVPMPEIQHALGVLSQAPPPRPFVAPSRLRSLVPMRVSMGVRNTAYDQSAYYMGATSLSERASGGTDTGWWVRLDWDLRPLWWTSLPAAPPADQTLNRAERTERLAERLSIQLGHWHKAESLALQVSDGDLLCREAQADAETALLVIAAVLNAAR